MYARSTTAQGNPQAMDPLIAFIRDDVMPQVEGMPGYVGVSLLGDRESGRVVATTTWDSQETMRASETVIGPGRDRGGEMMGAIPVVQEWEVVAMHRTRDTPQDGAVRLIWSRGEQGQLDRIVDAFRMTIPPQLEQMPGFCAVSVLADRDTMRAVAAVSYENRELMNRSADQALTLRDRFASTMGFDIVDVEEYDIVLAHLHIPEMV